MSEGLNVSVAVIEGIGPISGRVVKGPSAVGANEIGRGESLEGGLTAVWVGDGECAAG